MDSPVRGLQPKAVWEHFAQIAAVPRPSRKEQRIIEHVCRIAREHDLECVQDPTGNVLVRKPSSPGREKAPCVALQAHLDMVCEKNTTSSHNFDTDGITLHRSDGYITANGTTLGADNGIGVASALSVMLDRSLEHGPLEFLFTVDEETGLTGAHGLTPGFLRSTILLNLDSEEDGALYIGCSGGRDTILHMAITRHPAGPGFGPATLHVAGLRGGHSGLDIDRGRANAIQLLGRALRFLDNTIEFDVAGIEGGSKRNAIPRECSATLYVREAELGNLRREVDGLAENVGAEVRKVDPGFVIEVAWNGPSIPSGIIEKQRMRTILRLLAALPHGVITMSPDIPGLVETSTNLATISADEKEIIIGTSQRSSVASALEDIVQRVVMTGELAAAESEQTDGYPGWEPNLDSRVLKVTKEIYRSMFGNDPEVKAIHAGLECGIIGEKYPKIDMVSFGPTIENAHSPDERVEIASVEKFWKLLVSLLKSLS